MISITLFDLRYRARQFLIAVVGASLVFAMSLLLTGLAQGFTVEVQQTVAGTGAGAWVMAGGAAGRIASLPPVPGPLASLAAAALRVQGVARVDPVVVAPETATLASAVTSIVVVGASPGGLGAATPSTGRPVLHSGQAVVDRSLGLGVGGHFALSGRPFTVVGTVRGRTLLGGLPDVFVTLGDAQRSIYGGHALVSALLASSMPRQVPPGFVAMSDAEVEARTLAQLAPAVSSIDNSRAFMWVIAVAIVAALVYVAALERTRDFAVLKALGASSTRLFGGLAFQAVVVSLLSAAAASLAAQFMTGLFAQPVDIPGRAFVILPVTAVLVGVVSSLAALRKAVSVDPAVAFAGA